MICASHDLWLQRSARSARARVIMKKAQEDPRNSFDRYNISHQTSDQMACVCATGSDGGSEIVAAYGRIEW